MILLLCCFVIEHTSRDCRFVWTADNYLRLPKRVPAQWRGWFTHQPFWRLQTHRNKWLGSDPSTPRWEEPTLLAPTKAVKWWTRNQQRSHPMEEEATSIDKRNLHYHFINAVNLYLLLMCVFFLQIWPSIHIVTVINNPKCLLLLWFWLVVLSQ